MFWRIREKPTSEMLAERARKTWHDVTKRSQVIQARREERSAWGLVSGLFLGLTAGITAGLLFAPQRGDQTREMVQSRLTDYTRDLPEATGSVISTARGLGSRIMSVFFAEETRTSEQGPR